MTTDRKFRVTVAAETGPALSPAFLEFLKCKLIEAQAGASLGDSVAAKKAESLGRILGSAMLAGSASERPPGPGLFTQSPAGARLMMTHGPHRRNK